jgi:hypothetical protein
MKQLLSSHDMHIGVERREHRADAGPETTEAFGGPGGAEPAVEQPDVSDITNQVSVTTGITIEIAASARNGTTGGRRVQQCHHVAVIVGRS